MRTDVPIIQTSGGGFMLDRHGMHSTSPLVFTASIAPVSGEAFPLIISADLVEPVPEAANVVQDVLVGMAAFLRQELDRGPELALERAFAAANERVLEENSQRGGKRKIYVGLTCVAMRRDEIFVAQCAPGQLLVWQDGILHTIPHLSTWSARDITGTFSSLSYPLGFRRDNRPRISFSTCAAGDVIAVVSWQLARYLYDSEILDIQSLPSDLSLGLNQLALQEHSLAIHGAIFKIELSAETYALHEDFQTLDEPVSTSESGGAQRKAGGAGGHPPERILDRDAGLAEKSGGDARASFDTLETGQSRYESTDDLPIVGAGNESASVEARYVELDSSILQFSRSGETDSLPDPPGQVGRNKRNTSAAGRLRHKERPPAREGYSVEIFAGLLLFLSAAVVGVWQATKRDRPIHGPRDDGTLGLPHLQRWSDSYQRPRFERVRSVSPRFQINGFLMVGTVVAVVALAVVLVVNVLSTRSENQSGGLEDRLQALVSVRTQTDTSVPSLTSYESLLGAQAALDELAAATGSEELLARIEEEQAAVAAALNELAGVVQLSNVQVLGSLPPAPDGVTSRLFSGGGRVFVIGDALYELEQITGTLVLLLARGDMVGGEPVGTILAAAWNDDRPLAVDSHNVFMQDPADGSWHRMPLGTFDEDGHTNITAVSTFNRNLYFLTAETGQILKFDALDFSAAPEDWAAGSAREQLMAGVDLMIDGNIHTVLADGQILTFFRSTLDRTVDAQVLPELESVAAFTAVSGGQYFFMLDAADGRIVGVSTDGEMYQQFVTAPGLPTLDGATDLVINESNGITYVLADNTMYMVRLTLPAPAAE
jgi:hypothetical protein